jgi:hypothetical protein
MISALSGAEENHHELIDKLCLGQKIKNGERAYPSRTFNFKLYDQHIDIPTATYTTRHQRV